MGMTPDAGAVGTAQAVQPNLSGTGMPSGADIMAQESANRPLAETEETIGDNPVIEGLRSITMFAKQLESQQDPKAPAVLSALTALMEAMGGAGAAPEEAGPEFDPFAAPAPKALGGQEALISNDNQNKEAIPLT